MRRLSARLSIHLDDLEYKNLLGKSDKDIIAFSDDNSNHDAQDEIYYINAEIQSLLDCRSILGEKMLCDKHVRVLFS